MNEIERVQIVDSVINSVLSASASARVRDSVPASTRRAYSGDWHRFEGWTAAQGRGVLPATPETLADYAAALIDEGKAPSTVERALAAISTAHKSAGLDRPGAALARAVLRSWRRERAESGDGAHRATPVGVDALRAMVGTCDPTTAAGLRDRCLLVLGFASGARRSELAVLDLGDVEVTADGLLVTIRTSKTDRDSAGRQVALPYGTHPDTCPVRTFAAWRDALAAGGRSSGPLLVRVDRHGVLGRAPSGRGAGDGRLTGQGVALVVRRAALAAGFDPAGAWTGHSLRRGFATETYRAGADPLRIARHGGWVDGSRVLLGYVEEVDRWAANPLAKVGL